MDHAAKGAAALASSSFTAAVGHYNDAIANNPQAVDYYIKRSTAHTRVSPPDHASALSDAETALVLAHKRAKRELIVQSQLRRGIALFGLQRWADSKQCFDWVKKLDEKEKTVAIWEMKAKGKLKDLTETDAASKVTIEEFPQIELPAASNIKPQKPVQKEEGKENAPTAQPASAPAPIKPDGVQTPANKIRHEWYQTPDTVVVNLFAKGVPKDKATIDIQERALAISFPLPTGSEFDFSLDPLFGKVDPSASSSKVMSTKVECVLKKATPGQKWASIESTEVVQKGEQPADDGNTDVKRAVLGNQSTNTAVPSYPTSSRSGPKNWDKVVDDLTQKKSKKDKAEGDGENGGADDDDDGIDEFEGNGENAFLQSIFKSSNPDAQRAMMKSYQESNGTVLSTDWSEVSKKKVETSPPDGMVAKKWGE
ncbi:MAG: hypothetical protein Q9195_004116 [Heterodermia aff. obscurata]